ncbi:ATP-binding protein [Geopsychrobacter electrodiphilus]|uniref:ATP-binding protein n=1 Tax=Geopsychrobacter electrodiphilus TaxID=225196 RepID=UPI00035E940B|nr:ATP-binding protein [Geopsychrobacter electrodiphilus]
MLEKALERVPETVDITPSPRILRILGEIPFESWQCLAELVDNSIDAFAEAARAGKEVSEKKITVTWSSEAVAAAARTIEIVDTGLGMELTQLQNAARAGYSSNDPVHNLGLFGMGFNISTARLGENTRLLSATPESTEWTGIEIDFMELINSKNYTAKVITEQKVDPSEHGTKVIVSRLKGETYTRLRDQETIVRRQLENVYSTLLGEIDVEIYLQGKRLTPKQHCIWGSSRCVTHSGRQVNAVLSIDRDLGNALFDVNRNAYLSWDEQERFHDDFSDCPPPSHLIERPKRLRGWIGIQRYADTNDFGIDFIRNGRKIFISNKDLFSWDNPLTGTSKLEYPVELGSTVGGRIVGEVHVDYLLPTYQKNDFDRTDPSWRETIEALRGVGPMLPRDRKAMGYDDPNTSPIGQLANAYRRMDPGTKCLYVNKSTSRTLLDGFRRSDPDYVTDDKWWTAAQEADKEVATRGAGTAGEVDTGVAPSDNLDNYGPVETVHAVPTPAPILPAKPASAKPVPVTSTLDSLMLKSKLLTSWTGPYAYAATPPLQVKVWELSSGQILREDTAVPYMFFQDGIECDFVFNPRDILLNQYPIEPRQILCLYLAERFKARDKIADIGKVYSALVQSKLQDLRVDRTSLQEKADGIFDRLRERLMEKLTDRKQEVLDCVHESNGETEETVMSLLSLSNGPLTIKFQSREEEGFDALGFVPSKTILRLVDRFAEALFDGKVLAAPYLSLSLSDPQATERARAESKDRVLSFLKDALWILSQTGAGAAARSKDEMSRCAHSINFLSHEIVD